MTANDVPMLIAVLAVQITFLSTIPAGYLVARDVHPAPRGIATTGPARQASRRRPDGPRPWTGVRSTGVEARRRAQAGQRPDARTHTGRSSG
jgi:hypothetical protein